MTARDREILAALDREIQALTQQLEYLYRARQNHYQTAKTVAALRHKPILADLKLGRSAKLAP